MNILSSHLRTKAGTTLFAPLIAGMAIAQILATIFVYLSNQRLSDLVAAIEKTGYFPIPAGPVTASLGSLTAAIWGGLFFTLSIGAGLTLLTWAAFQTWHRLFRRNRHTLTAYAITWAVLLAAVNLKGMVLLPSLICLLVPLSTAYVSLKATRAFQTTGSLSWMLPVLTLAVLTGLWATQLDRNLFTTIRDHILLSNPAGRRVNDFYYRYTLYAAEAFKSFQQKTLRSCNLEQVADEQTARDWEERLAHRDILVLPQISRPDIRLMFTKKGLKLISATGRHLETTDEAFKANPDRVLLSFSRAADRFSPFRRMTLAGLLLGFPILLFVIVYGTLHAVIAFKFTHGQATWAASGICLIIGILLFLPMLNVRPITITPQNIDTALASDRWTQRVAALRYIEEHGLEIAVYPHYRQLATSPLVAERYWLARSMGKSRAYDTHRQLLAMIRDPHPNVICQAFYALGQQGRRTAINPIKRRLLELDHWYAQWYGYGALRKLGWQQTRSN